MSEINSNNCVEWLSGKGIVHQATCKWPVNYLSSYTSLNRTLNRPMYHANEYNNLFHGSSKNSMLLWIIIQYYFLTAEMSQNGFLFAVVLLHSLI